MLSSINNILFPTDFSDNTREALTFALELARSTGATIHLMHSIEEPYDFASLREAPIIADDEVKKGLSQRVDKLFNNLRQEITDDEKYKDVNIETCMQTGRALYTILEETNNRDIDLVIMSTKGRSGLEKIIYGSTTAEVVERSKVPVLAVPPKISFNGFDQLMFATDFQDGDLQALQYITNFANLFDSNITVFHSSPEDNLETKIMVRGFKELTKESVSYRDMTFVQETNPSFFDAISDQLEKGNFSLLVMARYKESFSLLNRRQTKQMSYYTEVPLLVLPGQELINSDENQ